MSIVGRVRQILAVRALTLVAVGILLVAIDFRTSALDLLPDPLGWVLFALGSSRLAVPLAARLGVVAALLSLGDLFLGFSYELVLPTGDVVDSCPATETCSEFIRYTPSQRRSRC